MVNQIADKGSPQQRTSASPKYGIFQSLQHMLGAAKTNPVAFTITLVVSYVLSGLVLWLTFFAMASLLLGQFGLLFASFGRIITVLVVGLIVYTLLYALVYAFTVGCLAYSLSPEKNSAGTALKRALRATPRVVKVNAWVAIIAYWPIAAAAFLPLLLLAGPRTGNTPIALLTLILVIAALIWAIIAHLRYALAPYIALFEPDAPVKQTLKRSQELLKHGGQWFIFKGFLLLLAIFIFLSVVTKSSLRELDNTDNWTINSIFILLSILIESAMVMLYFNRAGKQNAVTTPKSPKLLVLVIAILLGLLGLAAWQGHDGGNLSKADQEAFIKSLSDSERRVEIKSVANALENYYNEQGYYPAVSDITTPGWASKNLKQTIGSTTIPLEDRTLTDPNEKYINAEGSDYQYKASPENCTKCASFVLTAKLEKGDEFKQTSNNNTIKVTSNPTPSAQTPPTTITPTQQPTPASITSKVGTAYETYRIAADGSFAQASPVITTLKDVTSVELTVDLQCLGTCQFKLVSDTYTFSDTTVYTSSQKIKYQITKPGNYTLRNQFTPTAFLIKF
jgi:hypothetical protein